MKIQFGKGISMTQRKINTAATFALLLFGAPLLARAGEPTDQIKQTTDKILAIVQDTAMKGADKEAERQRQMRKMIDERFDWAAMARSALGKNWRELSEAQRAEYTGLFSELIEKTYMSKIESYSGEKILYKGDKVDGTYGVADVVIVTLKGTDIPVSYRVLKKGAEWLVYDVNIEGVSLVNNYRSQIGSILNSSNYDNLIVKLKAKIAAQAEEKARGAADKKQGGGGL
jgi:phospholipid transport system substrate-binding protein